MSFSFGTCEEFGHCYCGKNVVVEAENEEPKSADDAF